MSPFFFTLAHALPEIVLAFGVLGLLIYGAVRGERSAPLVAELAIALLAAAIAIIVIGSKGRTSLFNDAFMNDAFASFMKVLALSGSLSCLVLSRAFWKREGNDLFEYPILILLSTLGMMMLTSANSLIALYLGLELMSLALYVVATINRTDRLSSEAGVKYFVLGSLSSGLLLYGSSLLYGFTGSVTFGGIQLALWGGPTLGVIFAIVFILAGLAFKLSIVPFHMWTPDVYQGAPTPVTAFFATAPKMAAMAILVRVVSVALPGVDDQWRQIIVFVSIASMAWGSFAAIWQTNIKRMMAYSSIGNMGFALVGLAAAAIEINPTTKMPDATLATQGVQGVILYMTIYLVMALGVFACILAMRSKGGQVENINDLAGLARSQPAMAFFLAMLMFSLAGIPPLAGFFAKYYAFQAAVAAGLYPLAVIGVLLSAVAAFYYLRIVKIMYFDEPIGVFDPAPLSVRAVYALAAALTVILCLFLGPLVKQAGIAAASLF